MAARHRRVEHNGVTLQYVTKAAFSCLTTMKTIGPHKECLGTYRCLIKNILEKSLKISFQYKMNHWMLPRPELLDFLDSLRSDHS